MTNKLQAGAQYQMTYNAVCSHPATPAANDPVRINGKCAVAVMPEDTAGFTVVDIGTGEYNLSVKGINAGGNSAVAVNDIVYYTDGDTPPLSKKATGTVFGIAL